MSTSTDDFDPVYKAAVDVLYELGYQFPDIDGDIETALITGGAFANGGEGLMVNEDIDKAAVIYSDGSYDIKDFTPV